MKLYVSPNVEHVYNQVKTAIERFERLGYTFPDSVLIADYTGNDKSLCGRATYTPTEALIELADDSIDTIYHELAHITHECAWLGHRKEWKDCINKLNRTYNLNIAAKAAS